MYNNVYIYIYTHLKVYWFHSSLSAHNVDDFGCPGTGGSDGFVRVWELQDLDFHGSGAGPDSDGHQLAAPAHHTGLEPMLKDLQRHSRLLEVESVGTS